jgi:hypothetical protein
MTSAILNNQIRKSIPIEYQVLSDEFKKEFLQISFDEVIFDKFVILANYYISLRKEDKKLFDNIPNLLAQKEIKSWYDDYFSAMSNIEIVTLLNLLHSLNIKQLYNLCCFKIADMIKKHNTTELRNMFGIENDYTVEEEKQLLNEIQWTD